MAIVLRYVDGRGLIMERFIAIVHVVDTGAFSLKEVIYFVLSQHSLIPCRICVQCYDGASTMEGHLNSLKTLIMKDLEAAHNIHFFAHQLQLSLVIAAKNHDYVEWIFELVSIILNVVGASFKNRDMLREKQAEEFAKELQMGEIPTDWGLNKKLGLARPGDTYWGSHFKSLSNMIKMFPSIIDVIEVILSNGLKSIDRIRSQGLLDALQSFEFAFMLHLMKEVLEITNELNTSMQKKDQDIVNAMSLLGTAKKRLQNMRDSGFKKLLIPVTMFCLKCHIPIPDINAAHTIRGKSKRRVSKVKNEHYYRVEVLYTVVDMQLQEINNRFNEVNTDLLLGLSCLNSIDYFSNFEKMKVLCLDRLYPDDFNSEKSIDELCVQLNHLIQNIPDDSRFSNLKRISDLTRKFVETKKHFVFPQVFLLLKLALILPVATAIVERSFSTMKYIKYDLRNRTSSEFLMIFWCLI